MSHKKNRFHRRSFLRMTAAAASALAAPTIVPRSVLAEKERPGSGKQAFVATLAFEVFQQLPCVGEYYDVRDAAVEGDYRGISLT